MTKYSMCLFGVFLFLWLYTKQVHSAQAPPESSLGLPCKPYRTEISFPEIHDASGHVTSQILREPSPRSLLYVQLKWRRRPLGIVLYKNDLIGRSSVSQWEDGNTTYAKAMEESCLYDGYIRRQAKSYVALSTCGGLRGYIQTDQEMLFIEPRSSMQLETGDLTPHVIYTCEPVAREIDSSDTTEPSTRYLHSKRRRRSSGQPNRYLEVQVVVDHTMVKAIGSKDRTQKYVMALLNIANTVFQHKSLGINLKIVVVKMIFLTKNQQRYVLKKRDAHRTVNQFCQWSAQRIPRGQPMDYDISVLITKDELGPSGYAPITGLCNPTRSCAAVHDEGFTTGFVVAHEMAHVFGLFHDGHGNNCQGSKYVTSIMAAVVEAKLNHYWWSECSKRRMHDVIRFLFCLNNKPKAIEGHYSLEAGQRLKSDLGQPWSLDFQCQMEFGDYFQLCHAFYNDPCGVLWCSKRNNPHFCRTKRGPPLSGTVCGRDMECHNDQCQYVGNREHVDGQWGGWSEWSECSNGCGVGVKQRSRECDSPAPMFNGKDCEGEKNIWESCYNMTCSSYQDIRDGECDVWDSLQIRQGTHHWMPIEPLNVTLQCQQTCQSSHNSDVVTIDIHVADGAPCSYLEDTSDVCMEGKCLKIGCDGQINGTKRRDACGICDGDGSQCKLVQGVFKTTPKSLNKYLKVVTLPPGAKNITITQMERTFRYLALKDVTYGNFLLNGGKKQRKDGLMVLKGSLFDYVHGSGTRMESIIAQGPIKTKIDVMALPAVRPKPISIAYSYTVHNNDFTLEKSRYKWKFDKWSPCSVTCGTGIQTILYSCKDLHTGKMADKKKCAFLDEPRKDEVKCTRSKCSLVRYNYAMKNEFSECDAKCDQTGTMERLYTCEKVHANRFETVDLKFCRGLPTPKMLQNCKGEPCQKEEAILYQWQVSKPWTKCQPVNKCSVKGQKTRLVSCVAVRGTSKDTNQTAHLSKCDAKTRPKSSESCQAVPCPAQYQWKVKGGWSECPCGKKSGVQTRNVTCEKIDYTKDGNTVGYLVNIRHCRDHPHKPDSERECHGVQCVPSFQWIVTGNNSECLAKCGSIGTQTTHLACQQTVEWEGKNILEAVSDSFCSNQSKPEDKQCQGPPCKPIHRWKATNNWTVCTAMCGQTDVQSRVFICERSWEDGNWTMVEDHHCSNVTPRNEIRDCAGPPCALKWQRGIWSQCSVTCGRGKRYRNVYCGDPDTDLDDFQCTDRPPQTSRRCELAYCPVPKGDECRDMFSFCTSFRSLTTRCKRPRFKKTCCKTCRESVLGTTVIPPQNALEVYMEKRGLGRWRKRRSRR